ncbi:MAG: ABC transporter substrate-binding protein [Patescibacteria group bacterium]
MSKTLRYYYWLFQEFSKRHVKMIALSFFLSFFIVVSLVSFSSVLNKFLFSNKEIIGLVGNYNTSNLPDEILSRISHGLVTIGPKGEVLPALASSWEMVDNGREFRFHLKNDLLWDDGKKLTASDLTFNFKDVGVEYIDDNTLYFKLKDRLPIFPTFLSKATIKYPLRGIAGLYKVDKITTRQGLIKEIHLSPNKKELPLVIYKFFDSESKLISAYKLGEVNKITILKENIAENFENWKNTKVTKKVDYSRVMSLFINMNNQLLVEKDVRDAIAASIPYSKLSQFGEPAKSPIPPTSWAYNNKLNQKIENIEVAEDTLTKYVDSTSSAQLEFITYYDYLPTASLIDENFKTINLSTTLNLNDFQVPGQFDLLLAFWKPPVDPDQYFFWHSTQTETNITGFKNVRIDKLLEDGRNSIHPSERTEFYYEFQRVMADEQPAIFLYYPYIYTIERI